MTRIWRISNLVVLGLLIIICLLGTFYKHISFGAGLGDIFGYLFLYFTTLVHLVITVLSRKKGDRRYKYFTIIFLVLMIFICLKATFGRGPEYPWDGNIFYMPCSKVITIENHNVKKNLQISMCSQEYDSKFKANWNGHYMILKEGDIKIPDELKEYIEFPIKYIEIQLDYIDTLKINKTYNLEGEIVKIKDSKPIMTVIINK